MDKYLATLASIASLKLSNSSILQAPRVLHEHKQRSEQLLLHLQSVCLSPSHDQEADAATSHLHAKADESHSDHDSLLQDVDDDVINSECFGQRG